MAASVTTSRAVYAGLSCGLAFAVPVCAYAATLPFPQANGIVASCAVPFTVGALAGVGLVTAMSVVGDRRGAEGEDEAEAAFEAAETSGAWEHTASSEEPAQAEGGHRATQKHARRFFAKRDMPSDVPVIARAAGAMSEEDAWADLDALFSDDSPISCDATRSKDIYQIAFEELRRGNIRTARTDTPAAATGRMPAQGDAVSEAAPAPFAQPAAAATVATAATAAPATHAAAGAAVATAAPATQAATGAGVSPASTAMFMALAEQRVAARTAASASAPTVTASAADPVSAAPAPAPAAQPIDAFADRRGVWAAALDILSEPVAAAAPVAHEPYISASRAAAIEEGKRANRRHDHVNELIEEELGQTESPAVRRSSREYLRVIQGGTASMPALQAEA